MRSGKESTEPSSSRAPESVVEDRPFKVREMSGRVRLSRSLTEGSTERPRVAFAEWEDKIHAFWQERRIEAADESPKLEGVGDPWA